MRAGGLVLVLALWGCKDGDKGADSAGDTTADPSALEPPPEGQGFQLAMEAEAAPYAEAWKCAIDPAPNDEYAPVSWIEYIQNEGTHHMTISTPGLLVSSDRAPGVYDCEEIYGDQSLMEGQVQIFGSQGEARAEMHLPDGIVANIPPGLDIIHEIHYVNPTEETVQLFSKINAWTIPSDEVEDSIWGGQVRDEFIQIPAESTHSEWTRCVMNRDVEVHFLASHMHKLGATFTISRFDGKAVGEQIYANDDWHTAKIEQYDPPLVIPAGTGFEYTCTWTNPTSEPIQYGLTADDEMCNLAIVHTPFDVSAACEVVETSDGVLWSPE